MTILCTCVCVWMCGPLGDSNYQLSTKQLWFHSGQEKQCVNITLWSNDAPEGQNNVQLLLSAVMEGVILNPDSATLTVIITDTSGKLFAASILD